MRCLILCGGHGTRSRIYSKKFPKNCILIDRKPFYYYQIKNLKLSGFKKFYFLSNNITSIFIKKEIDKFFSKSEYEIISEGAKPKGTIYAIKKFLTNYHLKKNFFVTYGDSLLQIKSDLIQKAYLSQKNYMFIYKNKNKFDKSNIKINSNRVAHYQKKNEFEYIDYGLMCFNPLTINKLIKDKINKTLPDLFKKLIESKEFYFLEVKKRFFEIGSFKGYLDTKNFIQKKWK